MSIKEALAAYDQFDAINVDSTTDETVKQSADELVRLDDIIAENYSDMAGWIKKALPLLRDAKCGIDNAFGEGSKISAQIDALLKEASE